MYVELPSVAAHASPLTAKSNGQKSRMWRTNKLRRMQLFPNKWGTNISDWTLSGVSWRSWSNRYWWRTNWARSNHSIKGNTDRLGIMLIHHVCIGGMSATRCVRSKQPSEKSMRPDHNTYVMLRIEGWLIEGVKATLCELDCPWSCLRAQTSSWWWVQSLRSPRNECERWSKFMWAKE